MLDASIRRVSSNMNEVSDFRFLCFGVSVSDFRFLCFGVAVSSYTFDVQFILRYYTACEKFHPIFILHKSVPVFYPYNKLSTSADKASLEQKPILRQTVFS